MGEGVSPSAGSLAPCLPGTMFFPFSVTTWDSGKGQVAAQAWELLLWEHPGCRSVLSFPPNQPAALHSSVMLQARGSRACCWKTQYPVDLFLLPALFAGDW